MKSPGFPWRQDRCVHCFKLASTYDIAGNPCCVPCAVKEAEMEKSADRKELVRMYWRQRQSNAMAIFASVDPEGWEAWFDDDANVPPFGRMRDRVFIVEARIRELNPEIKFPTARLYKGTYIWSSQDQACILHEWSDGKVISFDPEFFSGTFEAQASVDSIAAGGGRVTSMPNSVARTP